LVLRQQQLIQNPNNTDDPALTILNATAASLFGVSVASASLNTARVAYNSRAAESIFQVTQSARGFFQDRVATITSLGNGNVTTAPRDGNHDIEMQNVVVTPDVRPRSRSGSLENNTTPVAPANGGRGGQADRS
jgi:hypothetical protein